MDSKRSMSLSGSAGRWDDEPPGSLRHRRELPPAPPPHPSELPARARASDRSDPLAALRARFGDDPLAAVRTRAADLVQRVRPWFAREQLAAAWSSASTLSPLTFGRYLLAFFLGVVATVAWQSNRSERLPTVAASPADVDSVRQSIDKLAAEVIKIRTVQQGILDRVSASPPAPVQSSPAATVPVRNAPRPAPAR